MKRRMILALALCLLLTGCGQTQADGTGGNASSGQEEKEPIQEERVLTGGTASPDGAWNIKLADLSQGVDAGTPPALDHLILYGAGSGQVLWEGEAALEQSVLWSLDSRYAAIARTARTHVTVTVVSTQTGEACEVRLPGGGAIPEYTFLPEAWGVWIDDNTLELTVGRGGDAGEQRVYWCSMVENEPLECSTLEKLTQILPGEYDFTHDGRPETVELVTFIGEYGPARYELKVVDADGALLYNRNDLALQHIGWGSFFAYEEDGRDYILDYSPYMNLGLAGYWYQIFSLDDGGGKTVFKEDEISFDVNFGHPFFADENYDVDAIAAFLGEIHGYLDQSTLLVSTVEGELRVSGSGVDFTLDDFTGEEGTWKEKLQAYRERRENGEESDG